MIECVKVILIVLTLSLVYSDSSVDEKMEDIRSEINSHCNDEFNWDKLQMLIIEYGNKSN